MSGPRPSSPRRSTRILTGVSSASRVWCRPLTCARQHHCTRTAQSGSATSHHRCFRPRRRRRRRHLTRHAVGYTMCFVLSLSTKRHPFRHLLVAQGDLDGHRNQTGHENAQRVGSAHRTHLERPSRALFVAIPTDVIKGHTVRRAAHESLEADEHKCRGDWVRKERDGGLQREEGEQDALENGRYRQERPWQRRYAERESRARSKDERLVCAELAAASVPMPLPTHR